LLTNAECCTLNCFVLSATNTRYVCSVAGGRRKQGRPYWPKNMGKNDVCWFDIVA